MAEVERNGAVMDYFFCLNRYFHRWPQDNGNDR